jgi:Clr5 domain
MPNETNSFAMNLNQRPPAPRELWDFYKPEIQQLYDDMTLQSVKEFMEGAYGFPTYS